MEHGMDFSVVKMYFHLSPEGAAEPLYELPALRLLLPEYALEAMGKGGERVQAIGLKLPASFLGTSFCNLCATHLIFAAQYDRLLDLSLDNLTFQVEAHGDHAHLGYKINELRWTEVPDEGREAFLQQEMTRFLEQTVIPAVEAISSSAGVKPELIWSQYGGQLAMIRAFIMEHEKREEVLRKFEEGFQLMTEWFQPELFNRRRNPFQYKPRYVDNPYSPGEQYMLRSGCCNYDSRENGELCYTCPRMTPEQREERKAMIMAASV